MAKNIYLSLAILSRQLHEASAGSAHYFRAVFPNYHQAQRYIAMGSYWSCIEQHTAGAAQTRTYRKRMLTSESEGHRREKEQV